MEPIVEAFVSNWFISLMMTAGVIWIIAATIESVIKGSSRERSRREIAAYVAEGSMTAEEGEKLLNAGKRSCS